MQSKVLLTNNKKKRFKTQLTAATTWMSKPQRWLAKSPMKKGQTVFVNFLGGKSTAIS